MSEEISRCDALLVLTFLVRSGSAYRDFDGTGGAGVEIINPGAKDYFADGDIDFLVKLQTSLEEFRIVFRTDRVYSPASQD